MTLQVAIAPQLRASEPTEWAFTWHTAEVTGLAFTPDGTKLITTSLRDDRISWIVSGGNQASSIGDSGGVVTGARSHAVVVSPDGTRVAVAGFRIMSLHDLKQPRELWNIRTLSDEYSPPFVNALAFSPDGNLLATSGLSHSKGLITIRNAETGNEIYRFEGWPHRPDGLVAFSHDGVAFSPDGKLFAAGTYGAGGEVPQSGALRVWDAKEGRLLHVWMANDSVQPGKDHVALNGIAFSPDSSRIAMACSDGDVRIWDIATKQVSERLPGHRGGVRRVTFSPDGQRLATAGLDQTVRLWDTESWKQLVALPIDSPKINALRFSPDGNSLAAGGGDVLRSGGVRMWQLEDIIDD